MDAERMRTFLLTLPHAVETMQWGANLVFWVGDKAIGGKMFAMVNLDQSIKGRFMYAAGRERYNELLEIDGLVPAPYLARVGWVSAQRWDVFRTPEWESELRAAHAITLGKLPPKVRTILALPQKEQRTLIIERRKLLDAKARAKAR